MSAEQNRQLIYDFYENVWHAEVPDYDTYLAPEAASYRQEIEQLRTSNPGVHFDLSEVFADGDTVIAIWTSPAVPDNEGISVWQIKDGKITGRTAYLRELG